MNHIKSSLLLISTILLFGCSQKIEGEAFLKNGDAVTPLADIEVRVVELEKFKLHLNKKQAGIDAEISKINEDIENLQEINKKLTESNKKVLEAWRKSMIARIDAALNPNSLGGQYMLNKQAGLDADAEKSAAANEIVIAKNDQTINDLKKYIESLKEGKNGKYFFYPADSVDGVISTRTQSNGKFEITLKSSRDSVLLAKHNDKYWLIKLGDDVKKINLTDSNENGLNCEVCVLK